MNYGICILIMLFGYTVGSYIGEIKEENKELLKKVEFLEVNNSECYEFLEDIIAIDEDKIGLSE